MQIQFFRSSLYNSWDWCQHQTALQYAFGFQSRSGMKAAIGTITHKALQIIADQKLGKQEGLTCFNDNELGMIEVNVHNEEYIDSIVKRSFDYYKTIETHLKFTTTNLEECKINVKKALTYNNGLFHPFNKEIVETEKFFDFEIGKPWSDLLRMKGTIDLITKISDDVYEIIDYKTGKRIDWATGQEKTEEKLKHDPQLLIYFYALKRLYPDKDFVFSLFYINDGGLISVYFDNNSLAEAEEMLKRRYLEITSTTEPKLLSNNQTHWKCQKLCQFAKEEYKNTGMSVCEFMKQSIRAIGLEKSISRYGNTENIGNYGSGGGTVR